MTCREDIASHFNTNYSDGSYEDVPLLSDAASHSSRLEACIDVLQLDPSRDLVVDLGAGTGAMAKLWALKYPHAKPMICVEPSSLLSLDDKRISPLQVDAVTFSQMADLSYDALVCIQAFHVIMADTDIVAMFKNIRQQLSEGGRVCIGNRGNDTSHIPWFKASHSAWNCPSTDVVIDCLNKAGFRGIEIKTRSVRHEIAKERWYQMLRDKFFSHLCLLTNQQIEEGILELDQGPLKGKDVVVMEDRMDFVRALK